MAALRVVRVGRTVTSDSIGSCQQSVWCGDYTKCTHTPAIHPWFRTSSEPNWRCRWLLARIFFGGREMKKQKAAWIVGAVLLTCAPVAPAQTGEQTGVSPTSDPQNITAYITLLRSDVRQQKAEMVGEVMQLSASDAAKFWPIYDEYDTELAKLNDQRIANIQEYASTYDQMTDEKADELIQK